MVPYKRPGNLLAGLITVTDTQIDPYVLARNAVKNSAVNDGGKASVFFFFFFAAILDAP